MQGKIYELLIKKIKEKKPLYRLDDSYVSARISEFLKKNPKLKIDFNNVKNKGFKKIVKAVRAELHENYALFWKDNSHRSAVERREFYDVLYKKIFAITGKPAVVLDISAGLNPLYFPFKDFRCEYIATELSLEDCRKIETFFKKNKIKGSALQVDLKKEFKLPHADVAFLFKILDSIEVKGHKIAERVIKSLDAKYAVVSFATRTIGDKKMRFPRRIWFEAMIERLGFKYTIIEFSNEIFYVVDFIANNINNHTK